MKKAIVHKYYLQINGTVIDLNEIAGLKDMEDFLNLSLFTSIFSDRMELINALLSLNFPIERDEVIDDVKIVKRIGNKKTGYGFKAIDDNILYKADYFYFSSRRIRQIIESNRDNRDFIILLLKDYYNRFAKIIKSLERKIGYIEEEIPNTPIEDRAELREELAMRKNSLKNFLVQQSNLDSIFHLLNDRNALSGFTKESESEYLSRITRFIDREISYMRGTKITPNIGGLVNLTQKTAHLSRIYRLDVPQFNYLSENSKRRKEMLKALETALIACQSSTYDEPAMPTDDDETPVDPDNYMFLESTDFENLLCPASSSEQVEAVETDIENLAEKRIALAK